MRHPIVLLLSALLMPSGLEAQTESAVDDEAARWYQIEVLWFRNLAADAQNEEHWPMEIELQMPEPIYHMPATAAGEPPQMLQVWRAPEIIEFADDLDVEPVMEEEAEEPELPDDGNFNPLLQYRGVPSAERQLSAIRSRLERRSDIEVLDFRAWRQPLEPEASPIYLHVAAGQYHGAFRELEGYIGVSLKRFLHVDTELWWGEYPIAGALPEHSAAAMPETAGVEEPMEFETEDGLSPEQLPPETYHYRRVLRAAHLLEQRRMRSDEVHYFDHPLLGVLVRISRWQDGKEDAVSAVVD